MIVQYSRVENDDELREYCIQVRLDSFFELPACKTVFLTCAVMFYSKSTTNFRRFRSATLSLLSL